mgnify:CR=1 FL=1
MKDTKTPKKLTRAQIQEGLDTVPVSRILGRSAARELTAKQKKFALGVAMGETKAEAYRKAYNVTSKATMTHAPYTLSRDDRVKNEIEALKLAIETEAHRTPGALRALVIQSLVGVITHPDSKPGQITAAAKVLGTVTEVAAFTERKEVRTITNSEDARAQLMAQIRELSKSQAVDAEVIERDAASLMDELKTGQAEPHRTPTPQSSETESHSTTHIDPHKQTLSWIENPPDEDPTPSSEEDPPVGVS